MILYWNICTLSALSWCMPCRLLKRRSDKDENWSSLNDSCSSNCFALLIIVPSLMRSDDLERTSVNHLNRAFPRRGWFAGLFRRAFPPSLDRHGYFRLPFEMLPTVDRPIWTPHLLLKWHIMYACVLFGYFFLYEDKSRKYQHGGVFSLDLTYCWYNFDVYGHESDSI